MFPTVMTVFGESVPDVLEILCILRERGAGDPVETLKGLISTHTKAVEEAVAVDAARERISMLKAELHASQQEHLHTAEKLFSVTQELDDANEMLDSLQDCVDTIQNLVGNAEEGAGTDFKRLYTRVMEGVVAKDHLLSTGTEIEVVWA